jgi:hypothetical protein
MREAGNGGYYEDVDRLTLALSSLHLR